MYRKVGKLDVMEFSFGFSTGEDGSNDHTVVVSLSLSLHLFPTGEDASNDHTVVVSLSLFLHLFCLDPVFVPSICVALIKAILYL